MSLNLAMILAENRRRIPEKTAVIFDDRRMTFRELDEATNRFANVLKTFGVGRDQKVMIMLPNLPEFVVGYFGTLKAGAVVVPINMLYKSREIEFLLTDSEAEVLVACDEYLTEALTAFQQVKSCRHLIVVSYPGAGAAAPEIKRYDDLMKSASSAFDMVMTDADDTASIVYTSGTTGKPKGAELTHFSQFFQARVLPELNQEPLVPDAVILGVLPFFHVYGQTAVMSNALSRGRAISLLPRFDAGKVLEVIERDRVTHFAGVPTMYLHILNHPDRKKRDLSNLTHAGSGGAPMPVEALETWKKEYGFDIREGYGLTETSPTATHSQGEIKPRYGSCGKAIWGCDVKIVDDSGNTLPVGKDGEVLIRGVNIMKGYYKNPEATAATIKDGWLSTGDMGKLDEEGYLYIVGRKKEMILRGGFNVYPREIEELIYEHPAVQECAVIGSPHPELGEEVKAVLYLKPGHTVTSDEIRNYCKDRIAAFKYPRIVEIRSEPLPKGPSGKILKRELTG